MHGLKIFSALFLSLNFYWIESYSSSNCTDSTVRIMTWNLLNFPSQGNIAADTTERMPAYRTVMQHVNPDILVTQENSGSNSISLFLGGVLNAGANQFSAGTFIDGYDTDNGIFYRTTCFTFVSNTPIATALRDVNIFTLVHIDSGDTIRILSCHLKASSGAANEALRASEVDSIRKVTNALLAGSDFIICGDFNIYGSYESAYQKLLQDDAGNDGNFNDPLVMPGVWNDPSYSVYHTQSPRTCSFGGGVTGGLDDRFDMILFSNAVVQEGGIHYEAGTLTAAGNDGLHYGDSVNSPPNGVVPQNVADALHNASDHLPVYADFIFSPVIGIDEEVKVVNDVMIFPNPSEGELTLSFIAPEAGEIQIYIYDAMARELKNFREKILMPGLFEKKISGKGELNPGNYFVRITGKPGFLFSGFFTLE